MSFRYLRRPGAACLVGLALLPPFRTNAQNPMKNTPTSAAVLQDMAATLNY